MKKANAVKLILSIAVCQAAGLIGTVFTAPAISGWYAGLVKPAFNPPGWIFGPAWTILYTLMGVALYLVWKQGRQTQIRRAMMIFSIHLLFNASWSIIFFGLKSPAWAFLNIIILWLMIGLTIREFRPIKKASAYLLLPYWAWVSFAAILNFYIWRLNI
ncbi:TspO protein [Candidatus Falkowbacteria bacterium RIFOXYB2_FULL_47_14]|uniref:TspO protein n=1 Tax=Candidatus Falkowbacteria bacterium RIFOXYA2_FULL_47_19 TaxID=1797994 RepID=A0A1F5SEC9_9BACT|nr:MAG: TspO protein [Candidatus Falkowbacteria bacterium RIFOXYA2_FULL_47_19]OGF43772.1 MAG: TspO protein [Candidatus Falkowbacteria bacterium RIFOXYB2_FULL_47_14]